MLPAALVAAVAAAGCYPVATDQGAAQQDLIGDVTVSADACTAPLAIPAILDHVGGLPGFRTTGGAHGLARQVARGGIGGLPVGDPFACPSDDELDALLTPGGPLPFELGILAGAPHQMLVAHRVPDGAKAPESFTATGKVRVHPIWVGGDDRLAMPTSELRDVTVTFRRAPQMDEQLAEIYAMPFGIGDGIGAIVGEGEQAVGYISDVLPGPISGQLELDASYGLPGAGSADPYAGPFNALTMLGTRIALGEEQVGSLTPFRSAIRSSLSRVGRGVLDPDDVDLEEILDRLRADRPVDCLQTQEALGSGSGPEDTILTLLALAWCPMPNVSGFLSGDPESVAEDVAGVDLDTRDLRVVGGEGFALQGDVARVPFRLRTAGPASDRSLSLTGATALPGATASPQASTAAFAATGSHPTYVDVTLPENAAPGTYDVTLTARYGGQTRTGVGRVVVLPKAPPVGAQGGSPSIQQGQQSLSRPRDNVYMGSDGTIAFGWICTSACGKLRADVVAPKVGIAPRANTAQSSKPRLLRVARGRFTAKANKRVRVKIKLFPKARRAVRRGRQVKALIVVRPGGRGAPAVRKVTIKLRKAAR